MAALRARLAAIPLAIVAIASATTACSSSSEDKCGGHAFQSDHGGHSAPLGACGSLVGQPVPAPAGAGAVFKAVAAGTAQVTIDPLAACGSTTIRCLVVTVTVTAG